MSYVGCAAAQMVLTGNAASCPASPSPVRVSHLAHRACLRRVQRVEQREQRRLCLCRFLIQPPVACHQIVQRRPVHHRLGLHCQVCPHRIPIPQCCRDHDRTHWLPVPVLATLRSHRAPPSNVTLNIFLL